MKIRIAVIATSIAILLLSCIYLPTQPTIIANGISGDLYFPRTGADPAPILSNIYGKATNKIDIAIYSLTHPTIVKAITDAKKRGIQVRVISDKIQSAGATQKHAINDLLLNSIPVKINTHSGLMHLKISIVDNTMVTLGSYNYSKAASETNDEVLIVITDPNIILTCQNEFDRLWISSGFKNAEMSY
jgi:phosphatidylserine/phosphatidylglycerophosphate/cardiolipin synthase-like enzyme